MNGSSRPHLLGVVAGLFLATGLVCSAILVTHSWVRIAESQTITVTGSARKGVRSDLIVWRGEFTTEGNTLAVAQRALKTDLDKVEAFLKAKGITNSAVSSITIHEVRTRQKADGDVVQEKTTGYRLSQSVLIRSSDVDRVDQLSRDTSALVEEGIAFTTSAPQYIYTKAGETKVEMLAEATKDARTRAEQIAVQGGRRIDQLRSAKMGVFQITPLHSIQTSWEGMNDTSSIEKTVTAVIAATFSMQ